MGKSQPHRIKLWSYCYNHWKYLGLWLLPKNFISRLAGKLAECQKPEPFVRWLIALFNRSFQINMDESAQSLEQFNCLQDFFTRRLKPGARTIDKSPSALISPCDGFWGSSGTTKEGMGLQIKGKHYHLSNLLGKDDVCLTNSVFATFYLSPRDYHRFHCPIDGHVVEMTYIPGQLWPVNNWAVQHVENLFCVNERAIITIRPLSDPSKLVYLVAVGATMVGKIHVEFGRDLLNKPQPYLKRTYGADEYFFAQGQELGSFMFGSTLVLVANQDTLTINSKTAGSPLKLGERIGTTLYES